MPVERVINIYFQLIEVHEIKLRNSQMEVNEDINLLRSVAQ